MILEAFVAILTVLSIAPFLVYINFIEKGKISCEGNYYNLKNKCKF